ncbi:MAG: MBL fold metallo-hydrolase [Peptostreptococcaceae bacterium]|nr:MBL fold metallo-hydrolase [Peptostreptococcaceae bacterium]
MKITLLGNAGIYIEAEGKRILVDGIYKAKGHPFSPLPPDVFWNMKRGVGRYAHADYLLFTHFHPDHYSEEDVIDYLRANAVKKVLLPSRNPQASRLISHMEREEVSFFIFEDRRCKNQPLPSEDFFVGAFQCRHLGKQYEAVSSLCCSIKLEKKTLLFTGDADYDKRCFEKGLGDISVDAVFVNPLFFNHRSGREILREVIRPAKVILYHLPFEKDDKMKFREIVQRDRAKYGEIFPNIAVLQDPQQSLSI